MVARRATAGCIGGQRAIQSKRMGRRVLLRAITLASLLAILVAALTLGAGAGTSAQAAPAIPGVAAVEQLLRTGQYEKARRAAEALSRKKGNPRAAVTGAVLAARAERDLGLYAEARKRLELQAISSPDDLGLRAELVKTLDSLGDRGAVKDLVNRSYDDWERGRVDRKSATELVAMAVIVRRDNNWEDANSAFRGAVRAEPKRLEANLEWGELFLEKHAADNALACFKDVLALDPHNPDAQVGVARALLEQGGSGDPVDKALEAALAVNPRHARALALKAELALDAEEWSTVSSLIATIRRTNPRDPSAAWLAAARALLLEDRTTYDNERDRRLETRPADGDFFAHAAEALVRHRRYEDARLVAADGVERDGANAALLSSLGNTLLRLGEEDEGLALLRRAWDRDPYDVRTYNLLNLFEKVIATRYVQVTTAHFRFRVDAGHRTAIEAVVAPFLEETYERYVARYGFSPTGPIVFELYAAPEHYAVRTVGLPRLGVAGVCFGRVITSQSPVNGAFNWGMVLAHELAHVFSLQLSRSRVPRWFTEGLAELETGRLRPEWRRQADLELAGAIQAGAAPTLGSLSRAFVRARDAREATLAYLQSSAAVEFLEQKFGFPRIREALVAYGRGERGPAVLEALAGMPAAAVDEAFRAHLQDRLGSLVRQFLPGTSARYGEPPASEPTGPPARIAEAGLRELVEGDRPGAQAALGRARARPGGADDPVVEFLSADLALESDEPQRARRELLALDRKGLPSYDLQVRLGLVAVQLHDEDEALVRFRAAAELAPGSVEARTLLAEQLRAMGKEDERLKVETEVLRLEPQTAALAKRVVLGHARAGHVGLAAELGRMALFIDPDDPDLHAALGRALAAQDKSLPATRAFEQALLFGPTDPRPLHRALADLYEKLGDTRKAASHRRLATGDKP
jgi:tetratricopeptide (TPR) repeat protein